MFFLSFSVLVLVILIAELIELILFKLVARVTIFEIYFISVLFKLII